MRSGKNDRFNSASRSPRPAPEDRDRALRDRFLSNYGTAPDLDALRYEIMSGKAERIENMPTPLGPNTSAYWIHLTQSIRAPVLYREDRHEIVAVVGRGTARLLDPSASFNIHAESRAAERHGITSNFCVQARQQIRNGRAEFIGSVMDGAPRELWRVKIDNKRVPVLYDTRQQDVVTTLTEEQLARNWKDGQNMTTVEKRFLDQCGYIPDLNDLVGQIRSGQAQRIPDSGRSPDPDRSRWWVRTHGEMQPVLYMSSVDKIIALLNHRETGPPPVVPGEAPLTPLQSDILEKFGIIADIGALNAQIRDGAARKSPCPGASPARSVWWVNAEGQDMPVVYNNTTKQIFAVLNVGETRKREKAITTRGKTPR